MAGPERGGVGGPINETCYRYEPKLSDVNKLIADWLTALTTAKKIWGFGLCCLHLRNVKGFKWNHKRGYRIYRELEPNMRINPRKRLQCRKPEPLAVPEEPNEVWSMNFMADQLADGRSFRMPSAPWNLKKRAKDWNLTSASWHDVIRNSLPAAPMTL